MAKPRIVVRGSVLEEPLLDTEDATVIEFYDQHGDLMAVFGKVLNENFWSISFRNDDDWEQVLARMGFVNKSDVTYDAVNTTTCHHFAQP